MYNPFIYSRIMLGQINVVISYLLMPVVLFYMMDLFKNDLDKKSLIKLIFSMTFSSIFSIHFFFINFLVFFTASYYFYFYKKEYDIKRYLFSVLCLVFILIFLNLYWLQGIINNNIFSSITEDHEDFFSPKPSEDIPAIMKIISMWGNWREAGYLTSYNIYPLLLFYILVIFLLSFILLGYYYSKDLESRFFYTLFWIGLILATGISHPYTGPFFDFLFKYIPFFNGFRDSHKFVSLIALSYSYFIPKFILSLKSRNLRYFLIPIILIFIVFFTLPILLINKQINPVSYPQDYKEINKVLDSAKPKGYIIYLPWQSYITYEWSKDSSSDGRISVPINNIVHYPVIIGPDTYSLENPLSEKISVCIAKKDLVCLKQNSVEYILIDKCAYYEKQDWINTSKVYSNDCIEIYKIDGISSVKYSIPLRFILSFLISLMIFFLLILLYIMRRK
ncbi:MAG: hypothetical protein Q8N99_03115 [Nanoarchaeota archaeon]|nr:hypothetical protein [Nanoarchaeota archaeon]